MFFIGILSNWRTAELVFVVLRKEMEATKFRASNILNLEFNPKCVQTRWRQIIYPKMYHDILKMKDKMGLDGFVKYRGEDKRKAVFLEYFVGKQESRRLLL